MLSKKRISVVLSLIILILSFSNVAQATHRWNLLEGYVANPSEFRELEIGKKIVYWYQRMIGEALVEFDFILFHFDRETHELLDVKGHWREDLPPVLPKLNITKEQAESMVEGKVKFSRLYIVSPKSTTFEIKPAPANPCWVVNSLDKVRGTLKTVIDAVEGTVLGYGAPPPFTAFSLSGPTWEDPCRQHAKWTWLYQNAASWFETMGYDTEDVLWPTEAKVKSHIQSNTTAMFYELGHSLEEESDHFASGCDGGFYEVTFADEIETWISGYQKMPFTFLASCLGMCQTGNGTLSYEFRKGSSTDTATAGYCEMSSQACAD